jgi:NADPH-dependent curcumin reductase CurA
VCGLIALYNEPGLPPGPDRPPALMSATLRKSLTIRGLIQTEFVTDLTSEFLERGDALGARRVAAAQGRCR